MYNHHSRRKGFFVEPSVYRMDEHCSYTGCSFKYNVCSEILLFHSTGGGEYTMNSLSIIHFTSLINTECKGSVCAGLCCIVVMNCIVLYKLYYHYNLLIPCIFGDEAHHSTEKQTSHLNRFAQNHYVSR